MATRKQQIQRSPTDRRKDNGKPVEPGSSPDYHDKRDDELLPDVATPRAARRRAAAEAARRAVEQMIKELPPEDEDDNGTMH